MHTALVWQGKLVYGYVINKRQFAIKVCTYRLGEACSHVAAVISCLIEAAQDQEQMGTTACTSQRCSWLPTIRNVIISS